MEALKHDLLSISQLCDKANEAVFSSIDVKAINIKTQKVVLTGIRYKHVCTIDTSQISDGNLVFLSFINKDPFLWNKPLGHDSHLHLNNLISNELVTGLPKPKFKEARIC